MRGRERHDRRRKADCPVTGPWWKMIFVDSTCIRGLSFCVITACSRIVCRFAKVKQSCRRWEFVSHNYHQWLGLWNVIFTKTTILHGFINLDFQLLLHKAVWGLLPTNSHWGHSEAEIKMTDLVVSRLQLVWEQTIMLYKSNQHQCLPSKVPYRKTSN